MPIPGFNINDVLPPYTGPTGPGGAADDMSPYEVSATEVVTTLSTTLERQSILHGWLAHRAALRSLGFMRGFQWLDGSFVEKKDPRDLDIVTFIYRPPGIGDANALASLMRSNLNVFLRPQVKATYKLDFFPIDLDGSPEAIVNLTRYYAGLFSHRRMDEIWKGMLQVRLEDAADDAAALAALGALPPTATPAGATP
jgi:hypothetical protein